MKLKSFFLLLGMVALLLSARPAAAQYQHASFFNGGTTLTATCTNTMGTVTSSDVFLGTAQGNTTVTMPTTCADYDVIDFRFTQAASETYTLTVDAGASQAVVVLSNAGSIIAAPTGASSGAANILHEIWVFNAVATTKQWELVTQETNPAQTGPSFITNPMTGPGYLVGGTSGTPQALGSNTTLYPEYPCSSSSGTPTNCTPGNIDVRANNSSTGTIQNELAQIIDVTGTSTVGLASASQTWGVTGIASYNPGTSGSAGIVMYGAANCVFSNATTDGHLFAASSTAGKCADIGTTCSATQQNLGVVTQTNAGAGTDSVVVEMGICP